MRDEKQGLPQSFAYHCSRAQMDAVYEAILEMENSAWELRDAVRSLRAVIAEIFAAQSVSEVSVTGR